MKKAKSKFKQTEIGPIPEDWEVNKLKDLLTDKGYIRGPFGSALKRNELHSKGIPVYEQQHAIYGVRTFRYFIDKNKFDEMRRFTVKSSDLIISCSGTLGRVSMISENDPKGIISQALLILRSENQKIFPKYLQYFLSSARGFHSMISRSSGSVQVNLAKRGIIENIELAVPPLPEQCRIAEILSSLDNKIELNRKMNKTLESIAQAIFKEWFVNFRFPASAKATAGRPGHEKVKMVDSEMGRVPEGWRIIEIGEVLELAYGKALKEDNRELGNVPVYGSNGRVGWHNEKLVDGPGIVVGRKGNPGIVTWVQNDFFPIDTTFYVIPKETCKSINFLYHSLKTHNLSALGSDSAVPGLNRNFVYMSKFVLPPAAILDAFDKQVAGINFMIKNNSDQNMALSQIRDLLLPRLMSGRVRV